MNNLFAFDKKTGIVIGTDEAGRGPAAGGVFASCVYFPLVNSDLKKSLEKLNDSKKLSKSARENLYEIILNNSINSTVCIEIEEIEKINILNSSLKAMKLACDSVISGVGLNNKEILVLVDGNRLIRNFNYPQQYIVKGDSKSASIAAASILAKVTRDRYMKELDKEFPQNQRGKNAGYLTKEHLDAIDKYGLTKYHRKSFLRKHFEKQLTLF